MRSYPFQGRDTAAIQPKHGDVMSESKKVIATVNGQVTSIGYAKTEKQALRIAKVKGAEPGTVMELADRFLITTH